MPREPLAGIAELSHLKVGALTAHPDSTPKGIRVAELTYDTLTSMLPAEQRIRWITSTRSGYLPQPYEQLAASYRRLGHDADARTVMLAKERHRHAGLSLPSRLWGYLQEVTIGYGYRPVVPDCGWPPLSLQGLSLSACITPPPRKAVRGSSSTPFSTRWTCCCPSSATVSNQRSRRPESTVAQLRVHHSRMDPCYHH